MFSASESFIDHNGDRIAYARAGTGPQSIVFLHNGGADREIWIKQFEFFAKDFTVWAFDFLGYGKSDKPDRPFTIDDQVAQLETFLSTNQIKRPILIGNCVGASTAIDFARKHPDKVEKLVLANVCGGPSFYPPMRVMSLNKKILFALTWTFLRYFYNPEILWGDRPSPTDPLLRHMRDVVVPSNNFFRSRWNMTLGSLTFRKFGQNLEMPKNFPKSILFWGEKNKIFHRKYADSCLRYLNAEAFYPVPNAGHFCLYEASDFANQKIMNFISK